MKKIINWKLLLLVIIFIATFLRMYSLNTNPPSMHVDEADAVYGANSILHTLHDQYQNFLPMQFQNNHRSPLYIYSVIPSVGIFGMNSFAARFPSAVFGILTVVVFFFLVKKLFRNNNLALLASFLIAINPWSIQISRTGVEEALALFLVIFGITLILYTDKKKLYFLPITGLILGLSLFSYHAPKIFLVVFLPVLFFYRKDLVKSKMFILFIIIFGLFLAFSAKLTIFDGIAKFNDTSIFNSVKAGDRVDVERHLTTAPLWAASIFHNKPLYYLKTFETTYVGIFSINYLFINGESSQDKGVSRHGQFYLFELPFFFIGLYWLFRKNKKLFVLLLLWMLMGAIPGGLTNTGYLSYRDVLLLPVPIIFSSLGIFYLFSEIKKINKKHSTMFLVLFIPICFILIASYLFTYFFDYPVYSSDWWQMPQREAMEYAKENQNKYDKIFVNGGEDWALLYAFYNNIDPRDFQKAYKNKERIDETMTINFGRFYFGGFNQEKFAINELNSTKSLYMGFEKMLPNKKLIYNIYSPDDVNVVVRIFESNEQDN